MTTTWPFNDPNYVIWMVFSVAAGLLLAVIGLWIANRGEEKDAEG